MKRLLVVILIAFSLLLVACSNEAADESPRVEDSEQVPIENEQPEEFNESEFREGTETLPIKDPSEEGVKTLPVEFDWRNVALKDVNSGEFYKVSDFAGKPVLVESFAVWCPKCTSQQKVVKELHKVVGDDIISVTINTDPNEDETIVKKHADSHGFDWRYSVASTEFTKDLIDEFGIGVVSAPSVPVVLVCPDQSARLLPRGHKDVGTLQSEVAKGCA